MLKRKITRVLQQWKASDHQDSLLIKGARQVGKTYVVERFGESNYKSFISLNFIESPELKSIFDGDLSSVEIKKRVTLLVPGVSFVEGETLVTSCHREILALWARRLAFRFIWQHISQVQNNQCSSGERNLQKCKFCLFEVWFIRFLINAKTDLSCV